MKIRKNNYIYKGLKKVYIYLQKYVSSYYIKKARRKVLNSIKIENIINVIFMIQYVPSWKKLEPLYRKMKSDKRFNPMIICLPSKKNNTSSKNDTYEYFIKNGFNECINAVENGKYIDIRKYNPHYIFQTRPYNKLRQSCYSSKKIRKYSLICNIMYGIKLTKSIDTMNDDYFNDVFCYFAFDQEEKKIFDNKYEHEIGNGTKHCYVYGKTVLEAIEKMCFVCHNDKKKIIWTPRWSLDRTVGGSNFFNYKDFFISLAKNNRNIELTIRPHPLMFDNFVETKKMTKAEVDEFKSICFKEKNIILDNQEEYFRTFWESDMLITDFSSIIIEYLITKKPIIYCAPNIEMNYTNNGTKLINSTYIVYNEEELKEEIANLINGKDELNNQRNYIINNALGDYAKSSENIINVLVELSKND